MIKYNLSTINDWNFGDDNIIKVYRNNAVCYYKVNYSGDTPTFDVCYAVVEDITQYSDTEFEDVFNKADNKWYKLNNLNQYEQYGVYGDSISTSGGTSRLPQGYTEVEYVESTGQSTVNLGIQLMANVGDTYGVVLDNEMSYTSGYGDLQTFLTCCKEVASVYPGWYYRYNSSTNIFIGGSDGINLSTGRTLVSGSTYHVTITGSTGTNRNHDWPLNLFSSLDSNKSPWRFCKGKLYNMQVTYNNNLVRDLVPCKNSSNVAGLYDLVNDVFYTSESGYDTLVAGSEVTPDTATYYQGKLAIVDGYEYMYSGSSWVNVGEVSGSTATLPNVPFSVNFNAKNYDSNSKTLLKTSGQLVDVDAVITAGTPTVSDGYLTIASGTRATISGYQTYFNRDNNNPNLTIISKHRTDGSNCHIFANRDSAYNWMYRPTSTKVNFHGSTQIAGVSVTTQPVIASVRVDSNRLLTFNNYTNNTSSTSSSFNYGATNSGKFALFQGYATTTGEYFVGDFYWVYMSQNTLTDEQVQQVIDYNEGGGVQTEYPVYYGEKADPLNNLTFSSMTEATNYAYSNCVYDGMRATIAGDRYYFDSEDENGWVKILSYYKVEDVTPNQASGWTISGSVIYNPDPTYYDDFDLETSWSSNTYKIAKITIYGYDHFTYYLRSYHQYSASYAYVMATNVDELSTDPVSMNYYSNSAITNTYNFNKTAGSAVNLSNYRRVTYNNLDKTVEHTFYVLFYGRNNSSYIGNATILIPKEQTNENWEQVTFSASSNVASATKGLYIDGNNSTSGGTSYWYYRWMIGLPSGSHTSYTNYSNYEYCPNVTSSTFTSVASEQRQVNFTYDNTSNKTLSFRLTDGSNVLTPSDTVYYNMTYYNSCGVSSSYSNVTFPGSYNVKVGGRFRFANSSNRHYIYGYSPNISLNYDYYVDNYQSTFDITYTKLSEEAVTITYTTYDPNDSETPTFSTEITWPYSGGTTSSTTLTSYAVPYTYSYSVSQTSNLFYTSGKQTYTAGQASRTITFTLYPNNREFASVADLEAYGYPWEGMIAYVGTDKYVYQNGEWVYNPSRLPAGYTEVEYIQNTGTSTINTNFIPNTNTRVVCEMECTNTSTDYPRLFGAGAWNGNNGINIAYQTDGGSKNIHIGWFGSTSWSYNTSATIDTNKHTYDLNKNEFYRDNTFVGSTTYSSTITASYPLGIFCYINGSTPGSSSYWGREHFVGKMYSCQIYDNGTQVRDLVPCIRDNDDTVGVYDIVNDVFYPPMQSQYPFVAGNPV